MGPSETNGYDFGNNQDGDTYVFLLESTIASWHASRSEFVMLAGPTPVAHFEDLWSSSINIMNGDKGS